MRWLAIVALTAAMLVPGAAGAATERRVALVIGNSAYENVPPLANPRNDAEAIAAAFRRLDFDVVEGYDLDNIAMRETLHRFARSLSGADVAAFYYAGHGMQVDGHNYLIPVDAELKSEADLAFNAVNAQLVLDQMMRESKVKLVLLDACRDNPLASRLASRVAPSRSAAIGRGLAKIENVQGTLIAFATDPGSVAYDGEGAHSPFTEALLEHIETPKTEIQVVMTRVRGEVFRTTREKQLPWVNVSLTDEFYLNGQPDSATATTADAGERAPAKVAAVEPTAPVSQSAREPADPAAEAWEIEKALWDAVDSGGTLAEYKAYLAQYPDGRFAGVARARIARLESGGEPAAKTGGRGETTTASVEPALTLSPATDSAASTGETGQAAVAPEAESVDPEAAEAALDLSREDRRMVQRRLDLIGHDPHGVDGIFGPNTRAAISEWQTATDREPTGFLDETQHAALLKASEDDYRKWLAAVERDRERRAAAAREAARKAEARRAAARRAAARKQQASRSAARQSTRRHAARSAPRQQQVAEQPQRVQTAPPPERYPIIKQNDRVYIRRDADPAVEQVIRRRRRAHAIGTAAGIAAGIAIMGGFGH